MRTCCIAQELLIMLCGDLNGKGIQKGGLGEGYIYKHIADSLHWTVLSRVRLLATPCSGPPGFSLHGISHARLLE